MATCSCMDHANDQCFEETHEKLLHGKVELHKKRTDLLKQIDEINHLLYLQDEKIEKNCLFFHKEHYYERHREEGPYGENYYMCKHCGFEK